jgi:hypothetical protein
MRAHSRRNIGRKSFVKTPAQPKAHLDDKKEPVVTFTHVIEVAPSSASFGGWGPKVIGLGL